MRNLLRGTLLAAALLASQAASSVFADVKGLSKVLATEKQAGEQGTPIEAVDEGLKLLKLTKDDVVLDPGCGDGRVIVSAVVQYGCRGLGIEIDSQQAELAWKTARQSDAESRTLVMLGDLTKYDYQLLGATCAYVYLYPEMLAEIAPKLVKLKRFVSYMHDVPGVKTRKVGDFYVYDRDAPVEPEKMLAVELPKPALEKPRKVKKTVEGQRYADWGGRRYFSEYNPGCNCDMCQSIRYQLSQPRCVEVEVEEPAPEVAKAGVVETPKPEMKNPHLQWMCVNGRCGWYWVQ